MATVWLTLAATCAVFAVIRVAGLDLVPPLVQLVSFTPYVAAGAASASWQLLLATGGSLLGRVLTGPRGRLATGLSSAAVIAVLAIALITG